MVVVGVLLAVISAISMDLSMSMRKFRELQCYVVIALLNKIWENNAVVVRES